jgi:hypothetical protein
VAAAITVLIVLLLGSIFTSLSSTAVKTNQCTDAFRDARAALQLMEKDLNNLYPTHWEVFASPSPTPSPIPLNRPMAYLAIKDIYPEPTPGNEQIYAVVTAKNAGSGDLCSVGYYCSWDNNSFSLRRFFRDSSSTFQTIAATPATSPYYVPAQTESPSPTVSPSLYDTPNPANDDLIARNVWNLRITAFDSSGNLICGYDSSDTLVNYPYVCDFSAGAPPVLPAFLEISFNAMSAEAARTVIAANLSAAVWMNPTDPSYVRLIKPNVYTFSTRIRVK